VIRTRRALVKDSEAMNELTLEMHNFLGSLIGVRFTMKELKDEMYENEGDLKNVYVAESDGKVVGYMAFSQDVRENEFFGRYYHLYHIAVKQEFQRKGVGTKLLSILLKKANRKNMNIVTETFCLNEEALKFYRKTGFKSIETVLILDTTKKLKIL
jgi:ribosomal protein S18 acetylase RimI-like enzyme